MTPKHWLDGPPVATDLFTHTIEQRNITDLTNFLSPQWPDHLHNPMLLPDMGRAVERIFHAVTEGEKVGIIGDYDMDGTPAAALLSQCLELFGLRPTVILPTRADGYGFSSDFVDRLCQAGVTLIITVDCGIRDHASVQKAKQAGADVIITDHHECGETLPAALAVINPKRSDSNYPFRELSGTGVAFKLASALIQESPVVYRHAIPDGWLAWNLDIVAMATVGDMVPLVDENRVLVYYGFKVLQKTRRLGLRRFFEALALSPEQMTYSDIAFKLIPKFNASGRLENMDDVFTILTSSNREVVDSAIKRVLERGVRCQLLVAEMLEQAKVKVGETTDASILLLEDERWYPGLTGLIAGRLVEEYKRPVGVLALVGDGYRGSMRSIPGANLPDILASAEGLIDRFGGHEQAAGLSVSKTKLAELQRYFSTVTLATESAPKLQTTGTIAPSHAQLMSVEKLSGLTPWGVGNEEPLWSMNGVRLANTKWLSEGKHLKGTIRHGPDSLSVIMFGAEGIRPLLDSVIDVYGTVAMNEFRGARDVQFCIKGAAPSAINEL